MALIRATVVPAAPLLVPALAGASAAADAELRSAVRSAVADLVAASTEPVVVVGAAPAAGPHVGVWDWGGFGLPRGVPDQPRLPLALAIGDWLLDDAGYDGPRELFGAAASASPEECVRQGSALTAGRDVRLLVVGDGSACRSEKAPGHLDPRAAGYDEAGERALATGDVAALLALDPVLGTQLLVGGRAPWQVLAGAAGSSARAELTWSSVPYGVTYLVARWTPVD
jgi:hypothetical protein